jgi:two-component system OmpR family sensor kinase
MTEDTAQPRTTGLRRLAPRSFRGVIVTSTVAIMATAMVVVSLGLQLLLAFTAQRDIDSVLKDRAEAMITVIRQASGDQVVVPADALEPGMRVYDEHGQPVAGTVEKDVRVAADRLGTADHVRTVDGPRGEVRLQATPFATPGGARGVLVVTQETAPYERSEFYALLATGALGLLVTAISAFMALRVTRQALAPVTRMAERAADWSEHDLTHRFALGPPSNELAALGETLDHLLDRVASAIRSEQRLTAELAHELRTPLTAIQGSADLALLRGVKDVKTRRDLEQISESARSMTSVIATLLDIARDVTSSRRESGCSASEVAALVLPTVPAGVEVVDRTGESAALIRAPAALVARAVQPLVDNAVRHAHSRITIQAADRPQGIVVTVADDGAGIAEGVRNSIFQPGVSQRGTGGLGLGIALRVARSFGGDISVGDPADGASFSLTLPRN